MWGSTRVELIVSTIGSSVEGYCMKILLKLANDFGSPHGQGTQRELLS